MKRIVIITSLLIVSLTCQNAHAGFWGDVVKLGVDIGVDIVTWILPTPDMPDVVLPYECDLSNCRTPDSDNQCVFKNDHGPSLDSPPDLAAMPGVDAPAKLESICEANIDNHIDSRPYVTMSPFCHDPNDPECLCKSGDNTCTTPRFLSCNGDDIIQAAEYDLCTLQNFLTMIPNSDTLGTVKLLASGTKIRAMFMRPDNRILAGRFGVKTENGNTENLNATEAINDWDTHSTDIPSETTVNLKNDILYLFGSPFLINGGCIGFEGCDYSHEEEIPWSDLLSARLIESDGSKKFWDLDWAMWNARMKPVIPMGSAQQKWQLEIRDTLTVSGEGALVLKHFHIRIWPTGGFKVVGKASLVISESTVELICTPNDNACTRTKPAFVLENIEDTPFINGSTIAAAISNGDDDELPTINDLYLGTFDNLPTYPPPVLFINSQITDKRGDRTDSMAYIKSEGTFNRNTEKVMTEMDYNFMNNPWGYDDSIIKILSDTPTLEFSQRSIINLLAWSPRPASATDIAAPECGIDQIVKDNQCVDCRPNFVPNEAKTRCVVCRDNEHEAINGTCEQLVCNEAENFIAYRHECKKCKEGRVAENGRCIPVDNDEEDAPPPDDGVEDDETPGDITDAAGVPYDDTDDRDALNEWDSEATTNSEAAQHSGGCSLIPKNATQPKGLNGLLVLSLLVVIIAIRQKDPAA